jgi:copper chaperone CopZ
MTHTYNISGVTCSGCVAKVKSRLLMHPEVTAAEITADGHGSTISMQKHVTVNELQDAIGRDSKYTIEEAGGGHHEKMDATPGVSFSVTYRPLFLIFLFIGGISLITSYHEGTVAWVNFMNSFMAGFFIVFSFFKFLDLNGFADSYSSYDLIAKQIRGYGLVYPFIELALGIAYLTGFNPLVTNTATVIVMGVSSIGVIQSVLSKKKIQCACLGAVFNLPMSTVTIVEDLLMVAMAGTMLVLR